MIKLTWAIIYHTFKACACTAKPHHNSQRVTTTSWQLQPQILLVTATSTWWIRCKSACICTANIRFASDNFILGRYKNGRQFRGGKIFLQKQDCRLFLQSSAKFKQICSINKVICSVKLGISQTTLAASTKWSVVSNSVSVKLHLQHQQSDL